MRWPKERRRFPDCLLVMLVMSGSRFPRSQTGAVGHPPQSGDRKQTGHLNGGI